MVVFWVGTIAELIKLFPVMKAMEQQGRNFSIVSTGQNDLSRSDLMGFLNTPVSVKLSDPPVRQSAMGLIFWFVRTLFGGFFKLRRTLPSVEGRTLVLHGDTVSTLMGAVVGKALGFRIAHVEAGLRSFKLLSPFPEEICRRLVSNLTDVHFCPNEWAVSNLAKHGGKKVCTNGNTLIDSLRYAKSTPLDSPVMRKLEGAAYFVFVIHRQENLYNESFLRGMYNKVSAATNENLKCFMLVHEPARVALCHLGLMEQFEKIDNLVTSPRLGYIEFMRVLAGAQFVVTDGGSNQEECYYLGKPCLILREATERTEGLGDNVLLSKGSDEVIGEFFSDPLKYHRSEQAFDERPSEVIACYMANLVGEVRQ